MNYNGITIEGRMLLAENRFNNSKFFYDENKERLKQLTTVPLRQLAGEMCDILDGIDPFIVTDPVKMVSRIRRDTRFSKDKTLYRENLWIMFMRSKHTWEHQPCMWFEMHPDRYTYGIGMFRTTPEYMRQFRALLNETPDEFLRCAQKCADVGAHAEIEPYKKKFNNCEDERVEPFYNAKYLCFMRTSCEVDRLEDGRIVDELKSALQAFAPMYKFLLTITERMTALGL